MLIVDIETNGLLDTMTKIHCIVAREGHKLYKFHDDISLERDGTVEDGVEFLCDRNDRNVNNLSKSGSGRRSLVFHNGVGFDIAAIRKCFPSSTLNALDIHDTYILSQLLFANEMQQHGLEAWGKRFGRPKPIMSDYDTFSAEMLHRCIEDVEITTKLWQLCEVELNSWDWDRAVDLEYKVYDVHSRNQTHWYIDTALLPQYIDTLTLTIDSATDELKKIAPKQIIKNEAVMKPYTAAKEFSARFIKWMVETQLEDFTVVGGEFCKVDFEEMNFNSSTQVTKWLLSIGWQPETYNLKLNKSGKPERDNRGKTIPTSPSLRDSNFVGVEGQTGEFLRKRSKASNRRNTLKGWQNALFDGNKIPTFAYTCGCNTGRYRHMLVVNVPKAEDGVFFGKEMRSLFIAKPGYTLVGCDSAQLEGRIDGHFTFKYDGGEYANFLLNTDIHQFNADSWGISRNAAKSPYYALSYQCSPKKISQLLRCTDDEASTIYNKYWDDRPALKTLVEALESSVLARGQAEKNKYGNVKLRLSEKPWIKGIDGRKLYVRSAHSLKNTLIQNAGMMTMKVAYCYLDKWIKETGIDARIVMIYHDEFVIMVKDKPHAVKTIKELATQAIIKGGEYFELNIPLAGEAKEGSSWGEIH